MTVPTSANADADGAAKAEGSAPSVRLNARPTPNVPVAPPTIHRVSPDLTPVPQLRDMEKPAPRSPFKLELAADLQISFTGALVGFAPGLFGGTGPRALGPRDPSSVNSLDRNVVGNSSQRAAVASDIAGLTCVALPHLVGLVDLLANRPADGTKGFLKDTMVLMETLAINGAMTNLAKYMARRARPFTYDPTISAAALETTDATLSFYSGHTSTAFSMATAASYLFALRHPGHDLVVPFWIASHALASGVAVNRVLAGRHFWTDVAVGAVAGSAVGLLVPYLHRDPDANRWLADLRLVPIMHQGGFGLAAMKFW